MDEVIPEWVGLSPVSALSRRPTEVGQDCRAETGLMSPWSKDPTGRVLHWTLEEAGRTLPELERECGTLILDV